MRAGNARATFLRGLGLSLLLAACATSPPQSPTPAQAFDAQLRELCGRAFEGRIVADTPAPTGADPFTGRRLVMHVRSCDATSVRIPLHVGDDRSRTWVVSRTAAGLRLKHDHRHSDGSADAVTQYGGDARAPGSALRQEFPVDAESIATFERAGLSASVTNVWALELDPGAVFAYELTRPGRRFRVEFDLARPVAPPPPPWGSAD